MGIKITRNSSTRPIQASQSVTANVRRRESAPVMAGMEALNPSQKAFARRTGFCYADSRSCDFLNAVAEFSRRRTEKADPSAEVGVMP